MKTDETICLNSKVNGRQPSLEHRIYSVEGCAPALTTGFHYLIAIGGGQIDTKDMETLRIREATVKGFTEVQEGGLFDASYPQSKTRRGRVQGENGELCPTLTTHGDRICRFEGSDGRTMRIRRLTERESFRLMGVRDSDIDLIQAAEFEIEKNGKTRVSRISSTQQYAIAGNSIVVDVLDAIFENMFYPVREEGQLF